MGREKLPSWAIALRKERQRHGWSQLRLAVEMEHAADRLQHPCPTRASLIRMIRGWENGEHKPTEENAMLLAAALGSVVHDLLQLPSATRNDLATPQALVMATTRESAAFINETGLKVIDPLTLEQLQADAARLAVSYLSAPALATLIEARDVRANALRTLQVGCRPEQLKDLHLVIGQLSGIMAYTALDLGYANEAMTHARMSWLCGDLAGHNGLRAWVRGTQSLIARFIKRYQEAYEFLQSGFEFATEGTAYARLASGEAQCFAHFGDSKSTHAAIHRADDSLEKMTTPDTLGGLFTFSQAKRFYYAGSSLIWLPDRHDAEVAEKDAEEAIRLWQAAPPGERSYPDELLAHVYLATARLQQGELDGAAIALRPVLDIPPERRISWHRRRLDRVANILDSDHYRNSSSVQSIRKEIEEFRNPYAAMD
jgi:transcriptional regulator with XRE-family HTH domain